MAISLVEEELEAFIRFEERQLFNLIQEVATAEQLEEVRKAHAHLHVQASVEGRAEDVFWE